MKFIETSAGSLIRRAFPETGAKARSVLGALLVALPLAMAAGGAQAQANVSCGACVPPTPKGHISIPAGIACVTCHTGSATKPPPVTKPPVSTPPIVKPPVTPPVVKPPVVKPPKGSNMGVDEEEDDHSTRTPRSGRRSGGSN